MRYIARLTPESWRQAVSEHEQMVSALRNRDAEALAGVLHTHLETKLETVKRHLREKQAHLHYD